MKTSIRSALIAGLLALALPSARAAVMDDFHAVQEQFDSSILDVYDGTNLPQSAQAIAQDWKALHGDLSDDAARSLVPDDFSFASPADLAGKIGAARARLEQIAALEELAHQRAGEVADAQAWRDLVTLPQFANADDGGLMLQLPADQVRQSGVTQALAREYIGWQVARSRQLMDALQHTMAGGEATNAYVRAKLAEVQALAQFPASLLAAADLKAPTTPVPPLPQIAAPFNSPEATGALAAWRDKVELTLPNLLSPEDVTRLQRLLARFIDVVPKEYRNGVEGTQVVIPLEYKEAQQFTQQAQSLVNELAPVWRRDQHAAYETYHAPLVTQLGKLGKDVDNIRDLGVIEKDSSVATSILSDRFGITAHRAGQGGQIIEETALDDPLKKLPGCNWSSAATIPTPMNFVDINTRTEAVRARYHASLSANINEVDVVFKKDCSLTRVSLVHTFNRVQTGPMYVAGKDQQGEWSGLDDGAKDSFNHDGVLGAGDYIFMGSDYAGAPAVINVGETPLSYSYSGQSLQVFVDGKGRAMKAGDKIAARFMIINKPREGQNNTFWLKKFIADYAIGGGKPGYDYSLSQGKLHDINYTMNLDPENGGAAVTVKKYDLPHNLLVKVSGMPANAIAGRYDPDRKQLLILPVYEDMATTSINTTLGDTRLYVGELFHCSDDNVLLSCVQDGTDKLLLEVHNPGDSAKTVRLDAVPGFAPLAGLDKTLAIPPYSSIKLTLPALAGTLIDAAYQGD